MKVKEINLDKTLSAIIKHKSLSDGVAPTVRELCDYVGVKSTSTMYGYLKELELRGLITRTDKSPRSIEVKNKD